MNQPLDLQKLLNFPIPQTRHDYDQRDVILYALGVGAGLAADIDETHFLYERNLQALPTLALVLGASGFWPMDPASGLDWLNILHGEQQLKLFEPMATSGTLVGDTKITDLADKGPGKAALIRTHKKLRTPSGRLVAEETALLVVRGGGGFGGRRDMPSDTLASPPNRDSDFEIVLPTSPAQAAIYRQSGDRNPLHIDHSIARKAGFDRPILHGLSTMGVVARALIHGCCDGRAADLRDISLRFTAPVYPGETIRTQIWREATGIHFRADSVERGIRVIDYGLAMLAQ